MVIIIEKSILFIICCLSIITTKIEALVDGERSRDLNIGPLIRDPLFDVDAVSGIQQHDDHQNTFKKRPENLLTGTINFPTIKPKLVKQSNNQAELTIPLKKDINVKKQEELLSTDCLTKRNEILNKLYSTNNFNNKSLNVTKISNVQRLKPRNEINNPISYYNSSTDIIHHYKNSAGKSIGNNNIDGEHIPQCTQDGSYEPIQCHKIGYCWCVNKFGQAIKNSATIAGQTPYCNPELYDNDNSGSLVVTGTTEKRIKAILKSPTSGSSGNNDNSSSQDFDYDGSVTNQDGKFQGGENDFERRVSTSKQPSLALLPNECSLSSSKARERASSFTDNIWIPSCDIENNRLYAERQCHFIKVNTMVCWCVDQITGLPLKTSEQLGKQPTNINCTEIKRLNGIIDNVLKLHSNNKNSYNNDNKNNKNENESINQVTTMEAFSGFSELCDTHKRIELVNSLIKQFKHQINEFIMINSELLTRPISLTTLNSDFVNETEIAELKFATLDTDRDGKLDIGEWFKFKNNFKLTEKVEDIHTKISPSSSSKSRHTITPLNIARSQRRCWRDFLLYCGNGNLSNDEPINLINWLNCTQLPKKSILPMNNGNNPHLLNQSTDLEDVPEDIYESLKAAVRSQHKNPFLGILKP